MVLLFAVCAFGFIQCEVTLSKSEVLYKLDEIVQENYGLDHKRASCMKQHLREKQKHKMLPLNISSSIKQDEFAASMKPAIDVAVYDCTAYSWFIFFISAISVLALICLSIYMVHCICLNKPGKEPMKEKSPSK